MRHLIIFVLFIIGTRGGVDSYKVENDTEALMFLERFGYISPEDVPPHLSLSLDHEASAPMLMAFQRMSGINESGSLDASTMSKMNSIRCGNKDMLRVPINESTSPEDHKVHYTYRDARYVLNQAGLKWRKRELTYKLGFFSQEMAKHVSLPQVLEALHQAFSLWSEVTNLDFFHTPDKRKVDIELSFTTRNHPQDQFPFDGPGSVLAHAFPPGDAPINGDVHFEDEEDWRVHTARGTDVLFVAVHEIGHALGLSHSVETGAIMAAYYGGYRPKLKLHKDDVDGIQALYGKREIPRVTPRPTTTTTTTKRTTTSTTTKRTTTTTTTPKTTTPKVRVHNDIMPWGSGSKKPIVVFEDEAKTEVNHRSRPPLVGNNDRDLCSLHSIDAITAIGGKIYVFKGSYVFQISPNGDGTLPGWPHHIGFIFPGLDSDLDAALTRGSNGKTYFFKGPKYWRFTGTRMDPGYPKAMASSFKGIPSHVDAAFDSSGVFYFVKGDKFWRFDPKKKPHVDTLHYPKGVSESWGLKQASLIDAAFTDPKNHMVYFFSGAQYYRLDPRTFKVAVTHPPYPLPAKTFWFGCGGGGSKGKERDRMIRNNDDENDQYLNL